LGLMNRNVAARLGEQALVRPNQIAIATPKGSHRQGQKRSYRSLTFDDLERRSSAIAAGLVDLGIRPKHRLAMLVPFGEDFIVLVFALMKTGATLVLIDPGMGRRHLLKCLAEAEPDGFVAIPLAQAVVRFFANRFPKAKFNITVGRRFGILPAPTLQDLERPPAKALSAVERSDHDEAAIIFTTGSTGPPKGVRYTHGMFNHQIDQLVERYGIQAGGIDLSCFPLFGLFNGVMGTTTIIPDMNPTRPADVDPPRLLDAIEQWSITQAFGSPALWTAVGRYCESSGRKLGTLRNIYSAGAPVSPRILRWIQAAATGPIEMHTPYGATEALPIASIEAQQVLHETSQRSEQGAGTCVGHRFSGIEWRVIEISDEPLASIDETRPLQAGEIGELMVCGPVVSSEYLTRRDQNALHKVRDGDRVWHRLGDVGYLDDQDRFWYCGRKSHRVRLPSGPLFTDPCEAIINTHPSIHRSALISAGPQASPRPVVIVEPWPQHRPRAKSEQEAQLLRELRQLAMSNPTTEVIQDFCIYPTRLPTDIRHNSKIFREQLAEWYKKSGRNFG
jgi:olefin beta-lactone synthetase